MSDDGYGTDLTLGPDGDLVITPSGDLASIDGPLNCGQALLLRLRTAPGELALHPDYGSRVLELIGTKDLDETLAAASVTNELRQVISTDRRFATAQATVTRGDLDGGTQQVRVGVTLTGGEELGVGNLADVRLDELSLSDAPTLADLSADLDPALSGIEAVIDPDDELPELEDLLTANDALDSND